jgi:hypothetical protein
VKRRLAISFGSLALLALACGGGGGGAPEPGTPPSAAAKGAGLADAGPSAKADAAPAPKPFAGSPTEATQLIGDAIDRNAAEMKKCVAEYRARKKLPHERVEISVGIDQEGRLLGASLKGGKQDTPFSECVQRALGSAPFPRSHAGVIQVTKSYEEIEQ